MSLKPILAAVASVALLAACEAPRGDMTRAQARDQAATAEPRTIYAYNRPPGCVPLAQSPHICTWTVAPLHSLAVLSQGRVLERPAEELSWQVAAGDRSGLASRAQSWARSVVDTEISRGGLQESAMRPAPSAQVADLPSACVRYSYTMRTRSPDYSGRAEGLACVVLDPGTQTLHGISVTFSERRPPGTAPLAEFARIAADLTASLRYAP